MVVKKIKDNEKYSVSVDGKVVLENADINTAMEYKDFFSNYFIETKDEETGEVVKASPVVEVFGEETETFPVEDSKCKDEEDYGLKAWQLNEIIKGLNNEEAYYGSWLYTWPDGSDLDDAREYFSDKESYDDLEKAFIKTYKAYHRDGLFEVSPETLALAHEWDKKLNLPEINDVKDGNSTPSYNDDLEKKIIEILDENKIYYDEITEETDENAEDKPYKVIYFYETSDENVRKAYKALKPNFKTVKIYVDYFDGPQILVSNFEFE